MEKKKIIQQSTNCQVFGDLSNKIKLNDELGRNSICTKIKKKWAPSPLNLK